MKACDKPDGLINGYDEAAVSSDTVPVLYAVLILFDVKEKSSNNQSEEDGYSDLNTNKYHKLICNNTRTWGEDTRNNWFQQDRTILNT